MHRKKDGVRYVRGPPIIVLMRLKSNWKCSINGANNNEKPDAKSNKGGTAAASLWNEVMTLLK